MKMKRPYRGASPLLFATLGLAMLAACNGKAPQGVVSEAVINGSTMGPVLRANAELARNLGMVLADSAVRGDQIQIKDVEGRLLPGAQLQIGQAMLVADEKGVVTLPAELVAEGKSAAVVRAAGFAPQVMDVTPGHAVALTPLDAQRTAIAAGGGGSARNSAGNLEVVFPPGALTGDSQVAVTRLYAENGLPGQRLPEEIPFTVSAHKDNANPLSFADAGYKLADNMPLGTYHYSLDLGEGVEVAPGAEVIVKFRTEGKMAELLRARHEAGDKFEDSSEAITRDADGNFWLAMRYVGPQTASGEAAKRRLFAAKCDNYSDQQSQTFQVKREWGTLKPGIEVPIWSGGYRTSNNVSSNWINSYSPSAGGHCVSGGTAAQYEHNSWGMQAGSSIPSWITIMTHHPNVNGGRCVYYQFDPEQYYCDNGRIYVRDPGYAWQTTYTTWASKSINALVTWLSDDPRVSGTVPNARVDFSHSLAPVRNNVPMSVYTASDGYASTIGVNGSYGSATASYPSQGGFTYGTTANYHVDCRTVGLNIVKMMPRVNVSANVRGDWPGSLDVPTNLGTYKLASLPRATVKPTIPLASASASFAIDGTYQPNADTWADVTSGAVNATWNGTHSLPADIWVSRKIGAVLSYGSNDASVATDQRPTSKWSGQAVSGASITFAHAQSGYTRKTRSEALSFSNVGSASTWGIGGTTSTITAERSANGVRLTGSGTGQIDGRNVAIALNANLPTVRIQVDGTAGADLVMAYTITDASGVKLERTMKLPAPAAGVITVSIPVEEPVGVPNKHKFEIVRIMTEDFANSLTMQDGSFNYPVLANISRGGDYAYPVTLKTSFVAPK